MSLALAAEKGHLPLRMQMVHLHHNMSGTELRVRENKICLVKLVILHDRYIAPKQKINIFYCAPVHLIDSRDQQAFLADAIISSLSPAANSEYKKSSVRVLLSPTHTYL